MRGLMADFSALDSCQRAMLGQAGQFGGIADGFSSRDVGPAMFGRLPVAGSLAELAGRLDAAANDEFSAAEAFLRGVERALDTVRQEVSETEQANAAAVEAIS